MTVAHRNNDPGPNPAGILDLLRSQGGRVTEPRRVTIDVLLSGGEHRHFSAEEIIERVRLRLDGVADSTIYRTLTALEEIGVVTHVHLGHGPSTYHLTSETHRHLVCRSCNQTVEVPAYEFAQLASHLDNAYGFVLANEHFALVGDCASCRTAASRVPLGRARPC